MANELATVGPNVFEQYANAASNRLDGTLLKFTKRGDWVAGKDNKKIESAARFIAHVDFVEIGWVRWERGRPVERVMGALADGFIAPKRDELSFQMKDQWEPGPDGKPKDPWQFTNILQLTGVNDHEPYSFQPSSKSGLESVTKLVRQYGRRLHSEQGELPIVALETDSYKHVRYGEVMIPILRVADWTKFNGVKPPVSADVDDDIPF